MNGPNGSLPDDSSKPLTLRHVLRQWLGRCQNPDEQAAASDPAEPVKQVEEGDKADDQTQNSAVQDGTQCSPDRGTPKDGAEAATTEAQTTSEQSTVDENNSKHPTADEDRWEEDEMEVILHGVRAPLDVPLHWLAINMSYADNFLYVVVRQRKEKRLS